MTKYTKKYFEKNASDKELKDSITLNSPVPKNFRKTKTVSDYFVEFLENQKKKRKIVLDDTSKKL